jgi:hypothetical protein
MKIILATTGLAAIALIAPVVGISVGSGNDLQAASGSVILASASQPVNAGPTAATPANTLPYGSDPLVPYGTTPSGFDRQY